ncbi:MAG: hypothetical protein HW408_20 [Actinobacteria bacterium]|nr:hypothetical protein [Actinomycetota bacterium]
MKFSTEELERKAAEALQSSLQGVPFIEIQGTEKKCDFGGYRADLVTTVSTPAGPRYFVAEVKSVGQPRAAREAVNQLWRFRENRPDIVPVFIAPYISPVSAELCKQESTNYLDLVGNCRLAFDNAFIEREGRPNLFAEKRDLRSLYSPKSSRVLRVLLANPGKAWKIQDLAKEAEVSLGLSSNVKKLLEDREWIRKTEDGLMLIEPEKLLAEWAVNNSLRKNRVQDSYSSEPIPDMEAGMPKVGVYMPMSAIATFCGKWKITEFALFGSALRDDFDVASDIDLLVTFAPDVEWSLFDHVRMKAELEELLGRKVDLVNRRALEKSDNWIRRKVILETARVIHAA